MITCNTEDPKVQDEFQKRHLVGIFVCCAFNGTNLNTYEFGGQRADRDLH